MNNGTELIINLSKQISVTKGVIWSFYRFRVRFVSSFGEFMRLDNKRDTAIAFGKQRNRYKTRFSLNS